MLFPRNLQEEEHRVEELEKREQDPERMEFQDEEDLDEMEEKEARGSTRDRTRALPGGPKMLEEDQDMTDDGCCGEKRTPDYKEGQRKRLKKKGKSTHLTDGEVLLPKQKMSVIHERDEEGEVDVSSAEEDY